MSDTKLVQRDSTPAWRHVLLRRQIWAVCLFIFLSDMIIGMIAPTMSLFARSLGASVTLVGVLAAVQGLTRTFGSIGIGMISDHRGRQTIMILGGSLLLTASLLYILTTTSYVLLVAQMFLGLGLIGTLTIALAYGSDVASGSERNLVLGLTTTAMGLGYAVGSFVGGTAASFWGYRVAYLFPLAVSVACILVASYVLPTDKQRSQAAGYRRLSMREQLEILATHSVIRALTIGSIVSNLAFGCIITFFPLYANDVGISQGMIGSLFALRALASTISRLPAGAAGTVIPNHRLLIGSLSLSALVVLAIPYSIKPAILALALIVEGVSYGIFMALGQANIAGYAGEDGRGAALGAYESAASLGDSVLPIVLGLIAEIWGIRAAFYIAGSVGVVGAAIVVRIFMRHPLQLGEHS